MARAVEIFPFILCCLRNTLVKLHNKRARKLPKRKLQFMPKTFGKSMKKEKYFTGSGSSSSRSGSNSSSSGSKQHAAYHFLVLANQPAKSVGQCNCLYSLSECFALALSLSLSLSASLPRFLSCGYFDSLPRLIKMPNSFNCALYACSLSQAASLSLPPSLSLSLCLSFCLCLLCVIACL